MAAEAQIEVSFSEWYSDADEQTAPWCVDNGTAITVMRTRDIYKKVDSGELSVDTKVWRDGRSVWLPISECYELTVAPTSPIDVPMQSGVRRVPPPPMVFCDDFLLPPPAQVRTAWVLLASLVCGLVLGLMVFLPYEPVVEPLRPALATAIYRAVW